MCGRVAEKETGRGMEGDGKGGRGRGGENVLHKEHTSRLHWLMNS